MSVPSPGGFFSSLAPAAAQTWAIRTPEPTTSTAENFYGVPWRVISGYPSKRTVVVPSPESNGPITAQRIAFSPIEEVEVAEITDVCQPSEKNESYQQELKQSALAHFERTKTWLEEQFTMIRKTDNDHQSSPVSGPSTPIANTSPTLTSTSPSKKSVRFAPDTSPKQSSNETFCKDDVDEDASDKDEGETIFHEGLQYVLRRSRRLDTWVHRQARTEAVHISRATDRSSPGWKRGWSNPVRTVSSVDVVLWELCVAVNAPFCSSPCCTIDHARWRVAVIVVVL